MSETKPDFEHDTGITWGKETARRAQMPDAGEPQCPVCEKPVNPDGSHVLPIPLSNQPEPNDPEYNAFWKELWHLHERWEKLWKADKAKYEAKYPKWMVDAATEIFAHDMCDAWSWNEYVKAATVIMYRHFSASESVSGEPPAPRCPKCHQPTASIYYMNVFRHEGHCNNMDCGYTGDWRDFLPSQLKRPAQEPVSAQQAAETFEEIPEPRRELEAAEHSAAQMRKALRLIAGDLPLASTPVNMGDYFRLKRMALAALNPTAKGEAKVIGDYSCAVCGMFMVEPCDHWKQMQEEAAEIGAGGERKSAPEALEHELAAAKKDAEDWKRHFEMYRKAWIRELGGWLIPKAHEIDALVLTTRKRCVNPILGNCTTPHWLGGPTADKKGLQQRPHPMESSCRKWEVEPESALAAPRERGLDVEKDKK
jgi:hypothetical protein